MLRTALEENRDISIERQLGEITVKLEYINERLDEQSRRLENMQKCIDSIQVERATEKGSKKALVGLGALIGALVGAASAIITALTSIGWFKW